MSSMIARAGLVAALIPVLILPAVPHAGNPPATPDSPALDDAPWPDDPFAMTRDVNVGQLVFLSGKPAGREVHHHHNRLILGETSLENGWVVLKQCHDHLDAVPRAQVVYNRERTRGLTIELADAIGEAWVKDASVQLRDVGKGARLCVKAETKALERTAEGGYVLRNGPFLRRFLDGYYPMRVSVDVEMPVDLLRFASVSPAPQDGFKVWQDAQGVHIDSWFEGRLVTELHFLPN